MGKVTKTFYTGATTADIAREIANQAGLDKVSHHYDELATRKSRERPHQVRITISVERVPPAMFSDEAIALQHEKLKALGVSLGLRKPAKRPAESPELGRAVTSLLGSKKR